MKFTLPLATSLIALTLLSACTGTQVQGRLSSTTPQQQVMPVCPDVERLVFDARVNTVDEFKALLEKMEGGFDCPHSINAKVPGGDNAATFVCDQSTFVIQTDEVNGTYQIKCKKTEGGFTQDMWAIASDDTPTIGVTMQQKTDSTFVSTFFDPSTLTIYELAER